MNDYVIVNDQYCRPLWTGKQVGVNLIASETVVLAPDTYLTERREKWNVTILTLIFSDKGDAEFLMRLLSPLPNKMLFFLISASTGDDLARYKLNVTQTKRDGMATVIIEGYPLA